MGFTEHLMEVEIALHLLLVMVWDELVKKTATSHVPDLDKLNLAHLHNEPCQ